MSEPVGVPKRDENEPWPPVTISTTVTEHDLETARDIDECFRIDRPTRRRRTAPEWVVPAVVGLVCGLLAWFAVPHPASFRAVSALLIGSGCGVAALVGRSWMVGVAVWLAALVLLCAGGGLWGVSAAALVGCVDLVVLWVVSDRG